MNHYEILQIFTGTPFRRFAKKKNAKKDFSRIFHPKKNETAAKNKKEMNMNMFRPTITTTPKPTMDDEEQLPNTETAVVSSPTIAAPPAPADDPNTATKAEEENDNSQQQQEIIISSPPTQRRSKREKYSPQRFVAKPSIRHGKGDSEEAVDANDNVAFAAIEKLDDDVLKNNDQQRRRTSRAHAAPQSYEEPPDDDDIEEFTDHDEEAGVKNEDDYQPDAGAHEEMNKDVDDDDAKADATKNTIEQQHHDPLKEDDSKPSPPSPVIVVDETKPRLQTEVRVLSGEFAGLTGRVTHIKVAGWCSINNPNIKKTVRMSNLEIIQHHGPPPPPPGKREYNTPRRRSRLEKKLAISSSSSSPTRRGRGGRGGRRRKIKIDSNGRPVRDRKPPQSLLLNSPPRFSTTSYSSSPSRPRRSSTRNNNATTTPTHSSKKRGETTSSLSFVRRSKRGPTPSPRYTNHNDDDDEEETSTATTTTPTTRRGRSPKKRGRPPSSSPTKKQLSPLFDSSGKKDTHRCKVHSCTKFRQATCEGYCFRHYRLIVLEGGGEDDEKEEEEELEVIPPPKKRGRRAAVQQQDINNDEKEEDVDCEALFDDPPRRKKHRPYCKVKKCQKWSQGLTKNGMCFKHFKKYGFFGGGTTTTSTGRKRGRGRSSGGGGGTMAKLLQPTAPVVNLTEGGGEIEVGSVVKVKERMGAGMNKPGGVGRVTKVYKVDGGNTVYDVKYVIGGREKGVKSKYLWLHDVDAKSPYKPPASLLNGDEEEDVVNEDDESIEDDELEGYDEFSLSQLEVPDKSTREQRARRRERQLNALSGNDVEDGIHTYRLEENWRCATCGASNRPSATTRCTTCQSYRVEKNPSEDALLERTRYELLNGNDFWICTSCVVGVPSLLMPCGRCQCHISFVPLTMPEFENFVRNQRLINREREKDIQEEWDQTLEEISDQWGERNNLKEPQQQQQQQEEWSKLPCKNIGCKEICAPNCDGFCQEHFRTTIVLKEPEDMPLVDSDDKPLVSDYFHLAYEQFRPCALQDWERTKKHRDNKVPRGNPGIACRHCFGREDPTLRSMGRYFPLTESSLYQQTFTENAIKHLHECPHCPAKVSSSFATYVCFMPIYLCLFSPPNHLFSLGEDEVDFDQGRYG